MGWWPGCAHKRTRLPPTSPPTLLRTYAMAPRVPPHLTRSHSPIRPPTHPPTHPPTPVHSLCRRTRRLATSAGGGACASRWRGRCLWSPPF
jgi:hypothetical protein